MLPESWFQRVRPSEQVLSFPAGGGRLLIPPKPESERPDLLLCIPPDEGGRHFLMVGHIVNLSYNLSISAPSPEAGGNREGLVDIHDLPFRPTAENDGYSPD